MKKTVTPKQFRPLPQQALAQVVGGALNAYFS